MPIRECCNTTVVCCDSDAPIPQVAALMRHHHVGDVIVTETSDGMRVPVGIVTDRDIVIETIALQVNAETFTAGDLMSSPVATVDEDAGLVETLREMRELKVRRMPVVNAAGGLYGIVTADDLINLLTTELSLIADVIVEQPQREGQLRT